MHVEIGSLKVKCSDTSILFFFSPPGSNSSSLQHLSREGSSGPAALPPTASPWSICWRQTVRRRRCSQASWRSVLVAPHRRGLCAWTSHLWGTDSNQQTAVRSDGDKPQGKNTVRPTGRPSERRGLDFWRCLAEKSQRFCVGGFKFSWSCALQCVFIRWNKSETFYGFTLWNSKAVFMITL